MSANVLGASELSKQPPGWCGLLDCGEPRRNCGGDSRHATLQTCDLGQRQRLRELQLDQLIERDPLLRGGAIVRLVNASLESAQEKGRKAQLDGAVLCEINAGRERFVAHSQVTT